MIATKKLFPYQTFQGDHVLEPEEPEESSESEDEDDVATSMFCMATDVDPTVVENQRKADALRNVTKKVAQLDPETLAQLPPHYKWVVEAFAAVAVDHALTFETATNHELILSEFKDTEKTAADEAGVQKLGKFWKAGTYGEITCPAVDVIAVRVREFKTTFFFGLWMHVSLRRPLPVWICTGRVRKIPWFSRGKG